jgi:transposase-like protein
VARKKKARGRGIRYSAADRKRIMAAARKGNLTGAQVQKQFGVSPLTYYRWRGPVRAPRVGARTVAGRAAAARLDDIRASVRAQVQRVLPQVIREQVKEYLAEILGRRSPSGTRFRV